MICSSCQQLKPIENEDLQLCASCNYDRRQDDELYHEVRRRYLEMCIRVGRRCPVTNRPITMDSDIHHMKGRGKGYADIWAKEKGINITLDVLYWLPVHREGHQKIELNPNWAKEMGYSLTRLDLIL